MNYKIGLEVLIPKGHGRIHSIKPQLKFLFKNPILDLIVMLICWFLSLMGFLISVIYLFSMIK